MLEDPLVVELAPVGTARADVGDRGASFESTEIGRLAGELFGDVRERHAGIHGVAGRVEQESWPGLGIVGWWCVVGEDLFFVDNAAVLLDTYAGGQRREVVESGAIPSKRHGLAG